MINYDTAATASQLMLVRIGIYQTNSMTSNGRIRKDDYNASTLKMQQSLVLIQRETERFSINGMLITKQTPTQLQRREKN